MVHKSTMIVAGTTPGVGNPGGTGTQVQFRSNATTFGGISGSSVIGSTVNFTGLGVGGPINAPGFSFAGAIGLISTNGEGVFTSNNTLDDGSGNATVSSVLNIGAQFSSDSGQIFSDGSGTLNANQFTTGGGAFSVDSSGNVFISGTWQFNGGGSNKLIFADDPSEWIHANWGISLSGDNMHPVWISYNDDASPGTGPSLLVGIRANDVGGTDWGNNNFYVNGGIAIGASTPASLGLGDAIFSPTGGVVINGNNGGATVQLTVSGSSGAGNYAIQAIGGQVGLLGSGTDGSTTATGMVGCALGPPSPAAFYASSGTYAFYGNTGTFFNTGAIQFGNKVTQYNGKTTAGYGVPAILAEGRQTAKIAAQSLATYANSNSDGSFVVSANINVTAAVTASFTVTCTYTDETNTSRTATLTFSQLNGTFLTAITNVTGVGTYEGVPLHIRVKASTTITIATVGTFTSVTYNGEGSIIQIA